MSVSQSLSCCRPDIGRFQALDLVLEFNYISLKERGLSGDQVREQSRDALAERPKNSMRLRLKSATMTRL